MNVQPSFEDWLENWYISLNEDGGVPITKDNVETMFDKWLSNLDGEDYIKYGNLYGREQHLAGQQEMLDKYKTK